jgi:hypothetical protein
MGAKNNYGRSRRFAPLLTLGLLAVAASPAAAAERIDGAGAGEPMRADLRIESTDTLRQQFRLPQPATYAIRGWTSPSMTVGVASGYGASWGDAFAGAGFQARTRWRNAPDGGVFAGFGLGDPRRYLGLEVAVTSFGTVRSCCRGGVSAKVHRIIPGDISVAVGVENLGTWGSMQGEEEATDAGRSVFAAGTKVFGVRSDPTSFLGSAAVTVGAGNGRYRAESDILDDRDRINVFGGVGVRLAPPISAVTSWTGQDLFAGVSIVPLPRTPLFITPGFADLTTTPRFILGIGYGFNYASLF